MEKLILNTIKEHFNINLEENEQIISDSFSKYPGEKKKKINVCGYGIFKDNIAKHVATDIFWRSK